MGKLEIKRIYPNELIDFVNSEEYLNFPSKPLSIQRAYSLQHNLRQNKSSPVLYLGFIGKKLVTYRGVLQDVIINKNNQNVDIIWTITSWTHPEYRKNGYSRVIFDEVSMDYNQYIFITNYGDMSYRLLSKRKDLKNFRFLDGHRFYYRLPFEELLPPKSNFFQKIKPVLKLTDSLGNLFLDLRFKFHKNYSNKELSEAEMNDEMTHFISKHNQNSLFQRNVEDFRWVLKYPWVEQKTKDSKLDKKYHFTTTVNRFYQKAFTIKSENYTKGFLFYSVKNEELKVHYIFCEDKKETNIFSEFLLNEIRKNKISYLVTTDEKLIQILKGKRMFLFSKVWKKGFFAGTRLIEDYPEILEKEIYMGDGDTIFT